MPQQLYDKDQILDTCLAVFAQYGYEKTSASMLAEAAGTSKALLFHHFKNKKSLYLSLVDRCFRRAREEMGVDRLPTSGDFFEVISSFSLTKLHYYRLHPEIYRVVQEAMHNTPKELEADIQERYGSLMAEADAYWTQLFEQVPLRRGVQRAEALELIQLVISHFEAEYFAAPTPQSQRDSAYVQRFHDKIRSFLDMIRRGIEAPEDK